MKISTFQTAKLNTYHWNAVRFASIKILRINIRTGHHQGHLRHGGNAAVIGYAVNTVEFNARHRSFVVISLLLLYARVCIVCAIKLID